MIDETEHKIMDAALKNFSKYGYKAATTMDIARDAGVNDSTLFRRFKTKKNLYEKVATYYIQNMKEDFFSFIQNYKCENPDDFLRSFISDLTALFDDNYDLMHLTVEETSYAFEPVTDEFIDNIRIHIEKHIKNDRLEYHTLALTIFSYAYMAVQAKHKNRSSFNMEYVMEGFIQNMIVMIQG
jgi:TetR/AcrR family transcriptional regulator